MRKGPRPTRCLSRGCAGVARVAAFHAAGARDGVPPCPPFSPIPPIRKPSGSAAPFVCSLAGRVMRVMARASFRRRHSVPDSLRKCLKCDAASRVVVRQGGSHGYCRACFLTKVNHRFRAILGKHRVIERDEEASHGSRASGGRSWAGVVQRQGAR